MKKLVISLMMLICSSFMFGLEWNLDEEGTLLITGEGEMPNFENSDKTPWHNFLEDIKRVEIQEGITSIGDYSFNHCINLCDVSIPDSVSYIGKYAFAFTNLSSIKLSDNVTTIGDAAFFWDNNLVDVWIGDGIESIGMGAFMLCGFQAVSLPDNIIEIGEDAFPCEYTVRDMKSSGTF